MMRYIVLAASMAALVSGGKVDKCPIFQTTSRVSPCYLEVTRTEDGSPVPPFVYAFALPHPSTRTPCPVVQSVDKSRRCYFQPGPTPRSAAAYRLALPLPKNADTIDESLYVTKRPELLSFPSPVIRIS